MKQFKINSFCKINLSLRVLKKLDSGLHSIRTLITFCNLHDIITISKIKSQNDKIIFSGKFKNKINRKSNTISKILKLLRKEKIIKKHSFKIDIKKNIPHGSGLGGGSSNAASLLKFLNLNMKLKLNKKKLIKLTSKIGFDVPICLEKKNTLLTGKKDEILRLKRNFGLNILIVYPNIICSTKKIYNKNKNFTKKRFSSKFYTGGKSNLINFLAKETNDLEKSAVILYPRIKKVLNIIKAQKGCYISRITGSGSACVGIFSNMRNADLAQKMLKLKFPKYWCVVSKTI